MNPMFYVKLARKARKVDLLHVQHEINLFGPFGLYSWIFYLSLFPRPHIVTTLHELHEPKTLKGRIVSKLAMFPVLRFSHALIVHTVEAKKFLGMNKTYVVPHGVYENPVTVGSEEAKKRMGIENRKTVGIFGFVIRNKRYELVINSVGKDTTVIIAGGPHPLDEGGEEYIAELRMLAHRHRVDVRFLGWVGEKEFPTVFGASDVVAFPYEKKIGQSGAINIALAFGKCVLATDMPSFKELKRSMVLFSDEADFREKLNELLTDGEKRKYFEDRAKEYSKNTIWSVVAEKTLDIYDEITECKHPDSIYKNKAQRKRIDLIKRSILGTVLDVGCSTGYVLNYVKGKVGLDVDYRRLKLAKRKYPRLNFVRGSAYFLPFKENSFGTVILAELLEHLDDPHLVLEEGLRVCKNKILITLPIGRWARNPEHKWVPTPKTVEELLTGHDHRVIMKDKEFLVIEIKK